ncbi:hypothetical protein ACFLWU_00945 [Chloroflexota bacterium]
MLRNGRLTLLVFILLATITGMMLSSCDESRGAISGSIQHSDKTPAANIILHAEKQGYPAAIFRTNDEGRFTLTDILTGTWTIEFYSEQGTGLGRETVIIEAGDNLILNFTIGASPPPDDMPKLINVPE